MKAKSKDKQLLRLQNQYFKFEGNIEMQKRIESKVRTIENSKH